MAEVPDVTDPAVLKRLRAEIAAAMLKDEQMRRRAQWLALIGWRPKLLRVKAGKSEQADGEEILRRIDSVRPKQP